ncbi:MAG: hypothetical protein KH009_06520 [Clostridiales bacterium]|nr:hypothetical protein [Clostridiales bacterium]
MGMDLYAGTLTRYYAHNWKTVGQQWAEENGYGFHRITPDGAPVQEEELPVDEIRETVCAWRDWVTAALSASVETPLAPWREDNESPYYTDKPDWDAYGALQLYGASLLYGEPCPGTVKKGEDIGEQPLLRRALEDPEVNWSLYSDVELWLPFREAFHFTAPNAAGSEGRIATAGALLDELRWINSHGWNAPEEEILAWDRTEGYPADAAVGADGTFTRLTEHTLYRTESLARFAYCIFYKAARYSLKHQVPIQLDY